MTEVQSMIAALQVATPNGALVHARNQVLFVLMDVRDCCEVCRRDSGDGGCTGCRVLEQGERALEKGRKLI